MEVKHKICDIQIREKHLFLDMSSTNVNTSPIALPMRRNPQHKSTLTFVGHHLELLNVLERIS
jgi:hypothetical protein